MNVLNERSAADPVSTPSLFSHDAECDHTTRVARRDQPCWTARNWLMKEVKMLLYKPLAPGIALGVILAGFSMSGAHAVQKVCKNDVCGRTTYDGTRVNISKSDHVDPLQFQDKSWRSDRDQRWPLFVRSAPWKEGNIQRPDLHERTSKRTVALL
jgi:hypothetical protein